MRQISQLNSIQVPFPQNLIYSTKVRELLEIWAYFFIIIDSLVILFHNSYRLESKKERYTI